jgi:hypothetical protein
MLAVTNLCGFASPPEIGGNDSFTTLLLHCEGADASTTFTNSAVGGTSPLTPFGNAQIDTAQAKFGSASMLLDGTGDFIIANGSADFTMGTGDFTIDLQARPSAISGTQYLIDFRAAAAGVSPSIYIDTSGNLRFAHTGTDRITGATALSTSAFSYVQVVRLSGTTRLYLNGVQQGSDYADSTNYAIGASRPVIGCDWAGTNLFTGWMDEIRVSKGIARSIVPPTAPWS